MGILIDTSTDIALFKWQYSGIGSDKKSRQKVAIKEIKRKAQILNPDGGLYLIPPENHSSSACRYFDFASIRAMPQELPYQTARKLTAALQIINPLVTDVRISKIENGLSVILNSEKEVTLGTLGNGAVTWASTLIAIFELEELLEATKKTNFPIFILIDEIGAGIHYNIMSEMWGYLSDFSDQYPNVQFVTTSHNDDCIRAFCNTFSEKGDVGNVVRLHKSSEDKIISTRYESSQFDRIVLGEWEVRG